MTAAKDPEEWERRYRHGVIAPWFFARQTAGDPAVPGTVRGTVIHGVLERIEEQRELTRILDEVIGGLDEPELAPLMAPGTSYRDALEEEIRRVVKSDKWKGYVEGEHYRELPFAHLAEAQEWRIGAFDLYRPAEGDATVIDFKTHEVDEEGAHRVAAEYAVQANVYAKAASIRCPAKLIFHFTGPNVQVEAE
jgi:ATP-dependent exoDNAse (exonuclease V) beta subunit